MDFEDVQQGGRPDVAMVDLSSLGNMPTPDIVKDREVGATSSPSNPGVVGLPCENSGAML